MISIQNMEQPLVRSHMALRCRIVLGEMACSRATSSSLGSCDESEQAAVISVAMIGNKRVLSPTTRDGTGLNRVLHSRDR